MRFDEPRRSSGFGSGFTTGWFLGLILTYSAGIAIRWHWQTEIVKRGHGVWHTDMDGHTEFRWKPPVQPPQAPVE